MPSPSAASSPESPASSPTKVTSDATIIQTRHRLPETPLREGQIVVLQVPQPEPLRRLEPREPETRRMHAYHEYGAAHVALYEDIARYGTMTTTSAYPVVVNGRHLMSPTPIPRFDNPKLSNSPAIQLFGAGREKRIYAVPPYTSARSLDFDDHPFTPRLWRGTCARCGSTESYLDEMLTDDEGGRAFVCSDTDFCARRQTDS